MIMPQWFLSLVLLASTGGMIFNIVFLLVTLVKERRKKTIW